ncbi:polymorphic toxin type 44 domain-containing protein [Dickeya dianthicola]|uniref:polymorphic toxin type 44 domain-containing protein n=1 Tax=Dickeya dianthicola TaxID=204039 RepID=UPI0003D79446|nr:polymorphic toxin type 44 domain-containing protein [Dickeya dianthicola]MCI4031617.1 polymorphic toxin type 44 domain-containing protein [Dickeya dianthicola]MCI4172582.1 polymorphic toxin type 44 domain-containing protein [Dickeya dianthicola]MCI4176914.1 polymorphic toxin type 44 domain-containing protein [Dickeya dianthicola]MCI4183488.1 polymorphic toxin type 44 domain-containing protein [Dickeya dianthicola]MCI4186320.1 polymorphic toxin type 44 domain-containing protein [Dickeya dian
MEGIVMLYPTAPEGVSVDANMSYLRRKYGRIVGPLDYYDFYKLVRNKGSWDFKQKGRKYENFGNFHYGAVGYAAGIPENILLRAAGCAQMRAGTHLPDNGACWDDEPYGDDPNDQEYIKLGIEYAKNKGY